MLKDYTSNIKNKLGGNKFFSNTIWLVGGRIFQLLLSLIIGRITAQYLGPSNYGIIEYTSSYVAFFTAICTLGFTNTVVKELMDRPGKQGDTLGTMMFFRICSSIISSVMLVCLIYVIDKGDWIIVCVGFLQSLTLIFQSFDIISYWYQSNLESKVSVKIQTYAYLIMAFYKIVILILQKDVIWFAFTTALENLAIAILLLISYYLRKGQKLTISLSHGKAMLRRSYQFILSGLISTVYAQMDRIMLKQMLNEAIVGLYSAAMNISGIWNFVLLALVNSAQPIIIASKERDEVLYIKQLKRLYAAIIWIGIVVTGGICLFAKQLIWILYGTRYLDAANTLKISSWYTIFAMLGTARGIWIVCEGKAKYAKYYFTMGAVVNIILNYLLIPYMGSEGAALATLVTQVITAIIAPLCFKETRIHTRYVLEAFFLKGIR